MCVNNGINIWQDLGEVTVRLCWSGKEKSPNCFHNDECPLLEEKLENLLVCE